MENDFPSVDWMLLWKILWPRRSNTDISCIPEHCGVTESIPSADRRIFKAEFSDKARYSIGVEIGKIEECVL